MRPAPNRQEPAWQRPQIYFIMLLLLNLIVNKDFDFGALKITTGAPTNRVPKIKCIGIDFGTPLLEWRQ